MSYPMWDFPISLREYKRVLQNPRERRFPVFFARLLSRVPFYGVFGRFITPAQFVKHFPKVRREIDADLLGVGRLPFWDWLYKRLRRKYSACKR